MGKAAAIRETHNETELIQFVKESQDSSNIVRTSLRTDERVIARIATAAISDQVRLIKVKILSCNWRSTQLS